ASASTPAELAVKSHTDVCRFTAGSAGGGSVSHLRDIIRSMTTVDDAIARLAEGQHGVFTRRQAALQGASRRAIQHRMAAGMWEGVAGDVVRIAGAPQTWTQRVAVAVLAGGPPA